MSAGPVERAGTGVEELLVATRSAEPEDGAFIDGLLTADAAHELRDLPEPLRTSLVRTQVIARATAYAQLWPQARDWVIMVGGESAGRILIAATGRDAIDVGSGPGDLHIVDFRLAPRWRGRGIGATVLTDLIERSRAAGRGLRLSARAGSAQLGWYRRSGFEAISSSPTDVTLQLAPAP